MESIISLIRKHQDILFYGFFGVCTTLVNIAAYWICAHPAGLGTMPSTVIAWVLAVLFAYFTNRRWVFHSAARTLNEKSREMIKFFSCRLGTGILDWIIMFVFVSKLHFNDVLIKAAANILVIILNYVAGKLIIFRRKEE